MSDSVDPLPLELSGRWRAGIANEELRRVWYEETFDDAAFVDIDVPGHWRSDESLADNDEPVLYRRRFSALRPDTGVRAWLRFAGVCAQGDVWLDGHYLGDTEGAWVPRSFEVTEALAARSEHVLGVEVTSPPAPDDGPKRGLLGTWQTGPYVQRGWNPGGIWRPVTVHRTGPVAITTHRVLCAAATRERATVRITCTLDSVDARTVTIRTTVAEHDHELRQALARGTNTVTWSVDVPDPPLWWPYELGDQPMVDVEVRVLDDGDDPASASASAPEPATRSDGFRTRCGLRRIDLRDWILTINGERMFLKGVLAGPAAHALGTAPVDRFTGVIDAARDAGCNLVRVHGHLSRDELYDAADTAGMLVWQDLPLFRAQHRSVRRLAGRTAGCAIDALGAHPSIAIWCGHDEPDETDGTRAGFGRRFVTQELPSWNRSVLDRSVKHALSGADPTRPVIGASGLWPHPPKFAGTDTHLELGWTSGEAEDLARLARAIPRAVRFVQMTPSPSFPTDHRPAGVTRWPLVDLDDLVAGSDVDLELIAQRLPLDAFDDVDAWLHAGQRYQAQLLRTQIEILRRLKYRPVGGFVVAHLADLKRTMSPALIDETGTAKTAHAAVRAACAPVLVTLEHWPGHVHPGDRFACDVHVVNDRHVPLPDARVQVLLRWDDGEVAWEFAGDVADDSCAHVGRIEIDTPRDATRLTVTLTVQAAESDGSSPAATARYTTPVHQS